MKVVVQSVFVFVFVFAVLLVTSCAQEPDRTDPKIVAEEFFEAVFVDQDRDKAVSFVLESEREGFLEIFDQIVAITETHPYPDDPKISISFFQGQAKARVENWDFDSSMRLEQVGGVWWIDG